MVYIDTRARGEPYIDDALSLPVYADIAAGPGIEASDVEPEEYLVLHRSNLAVPGPYYTFRVRGESMMPFIMDGDYVVVTEAWHDYTLDGRIVAVRAIEGVTLKQLVCDKKKKISKLIPYNSNYPIREFDEYSPETQIVGMLVLVVRKLIEGE